MARCFAVLGASGVGKSTLVDQLVALEGGRAQPPSATEARVARFDYLGESWSAIDCPGSPEFIQETVDSLLVADAAVVVVSPDPDNAVLAAPYLRAVEAAGTPAIVFINRMDEATARVRDIAAALQNYCNHIIILRQIPMRQGDQVVGAVDLVSERAWRYREGEESKLVEIPSELADREQEARDELLEGLSEFDDWLLEQIIEDQTPATGPVYSICERVLRESQAMEALIGAASHGNGIRRLMKALRHEAPHVEALRDRLAGGAKCDGPPAAVSFSAKHRKHVGKVTYLRMLTDDPKAASQLGGGHVGLLADPTEEKTSAIDKAEPGAIVAAVKSDHLIRGRLYTRSGASPAPAWRRPVKPLTSRVIVPKNERDEVKLSEALSRLAEDDPAMSVSQDPESGAQVVRAQGAQHLRAISEALNDTFGIETDDAPVAGNYRETITRKVDTHYRHKKQSGGAGQFADIKITVAPNPRGAGFTFDETVKGGAVPRNYIPAVEAGARECMLRGPLGFPVVDVGVTLTDGQHHSVDSSDMAFRIAARSGVHQALEEAVPVLLEPFYDVRFSVPSVFTGNLVPMVSSHGGQVLGFDRDPDAKGWDIFRAMLPGGVLEDLIRELRSATRGVGRFEAEFDHYQELYGRDADRIVETRKEEAARR